MIDDTFVWDSENLENLENPIVKFIPYKNVDLDNNSWSSSDPAPDFGNVLAGIDEDGIIKAVGVICTSNKVSWENQTANLLFQDVEKVDGKTRAEIAELSGLHVDVITTNHDVSQNLLAKLIREIDKATNNFMR